MIVRMRVLLLLVRIVRNWNIWTYPAVELLLIRLIYKLQAITSLFLSPKNIGNVIAISLFSLPLEKWGIGTKGKEQFVLNLLVWFSMIYWVSQKKSLWNFRKGWVIFSKTVFELKTTTWNHIISKRNHILSHIAKKLRTRQCLKYLNNFRGKIRTILSINSTFLKL
jgi:hypothetical protein